MPATDRFANDSFSLVAGPPSLRGYSLDALLPTPTAADSRSDQEFAEYPVDELLAALLNLPGVRLVSEPGRRGASWAASWENEDRLILFEDVSEWDGFFGEVHVRCDCRVVDLLDLWESLRGQYPGLWLIGPSGRFLSPGAFYHWCRGFDANWRTSDVLTLARGIRADAAFDRLPILADALQDAGCDESDLLDYCRTGRIDTRESWAVDVVLSSTDRDGFMRIGSWEDFYRRLVIDPMGGQVTPKPTAAQLDQYELEAAFRLPQSYREYIMVFGPGRIFTDWDIAAPGYEHGWRWDLQTLDENMRPSEWSINKRFSEEQRDRVGRCRYFCSEYKDSYFWDLTEVCDPKTNEYAVYRCTACGQILRVANSFREFMEGAVVEILTASGWKDSNPDLGPRLRFEPVTIR